MIDKKRMEKNLSRVLLVHRLKFVIDILDKYGSLCLSISEDVTRPENNCLGRIRCGLGIMIF